MANDVLNSWQEFKDDGGTLLARGSIEFFTDASRTTQKTLISGSNPYELDDFGQIRGDVQYTGLATLVITNAAGLEIRQLDEVAPSSDGNTGSITKYRDSVASMVADVSLIEGDLVRTAAYYANTNIGGARYVIVAGGTGTADDYLFHNLGNGLQAKLIDRERRKSPLYAGARGDGGSDDTTPVQAVTSLGGDIAIPKDFEFVVSNIDISKNVRFVGGGTIKQAGSSSGNCLRITTTAVTKVKFKGVTLDGNQQNGNQGNAMVGWVLS